MTILVVRGHARVRMKGYLLTVAVPEKDEQTGGKKYRVAHQLPLVDLELLVLVGTRISISTAALLALAKAGIPLAVHGREAHTSIHPPYTVALPEARIAQVKALETDTGLKTAKKMIKAKIEGLANLAEHLAKQDKDTNTAAKAEKLRRDAEKAEQAKTPRDLLTVEAELTKKAWQLLTPRIPSTYNFPGRSPRSPDPINAAINYTYAILYSLSTHALTAAGLDPHIGFLHTTRPGSRALAYDYSEQYKPLAIHAVITAARKTTLALAADKLLDATSLETTTRTLYSYLKRRPPGRRHTNRGYIYIKAWELRNTLTKGTRYNPYTYKPR